MAAGEEDGTGLVGPSGAIEEVRRSVRRAAPLAVTAFITGETGAGKKEVARAIHRAGLHSQLPLVIVDCRARTESTLETLLFGEGEASGGLLSSPRIGTLFLAGVDEAPLPVQRRLLQALEEDVYDSSDPTSPHRVNVRVLAGASAQHREAASQGRLWPELWERLILFEIPIPPLRERKDDLPALVGHLLGRLSRKLGRPLPRLDPEAEALLLDYSWPSNVRELRNVLEHALVLLEGSVLRPQDFPSFSSVGRSREDVENLREARKDFERRHIERILLRHGGDKDLAAKALGVDVTTLYRKLASQRGG